MGMVQEFAMKNEIPLEDLEIRILFDQPASEESSIFHGLHLEGAAWNSNASQITELTATCDFQSAQPLKPFRVEVSLKNVEEEGQFYCPLYVTPARNGDLAASGKNPNLIGLFSIGFDQQLSVSHWIKRGVAISCQSGADME